MAYDSDDDDEIFKFSAPRLRSTPNKRPRPNDCASNNDSSFVIESDSDEDEPSLRKGKGAQGGSKAANLLRNLKKSSSSSGEDGSPCGSHRPQGSNIASHIVNVIDSDDEGIRSRSPSPPPVAYGTANSLVRYVCAVLCHCSNMVYCGVSVLSHSTRPWHAALCCG